MDIWDSEQYWKKAIRYVELSAHPERDAWERPFWLSLALEFLARAALTKIHPALNADPEGDGLNLLYAFGYELKGQPKSLPIHAVLLRLQKVVPELTKPRREFCDFFSNVRNQELHTCEMPFESLAESKWLARFYDVCHVLCDHLGKDPKELFGVSEAAAAAGLINALKSEKIGAVKSKIAAHRTVFTSKTEEEQKQMQSQSLLLSKQWLHTETAVECPACQCLAKLVGTVERVSRPFYDGDELLERNTVLANRLDCAACGLALSDVDELHVAGIEPHFHYNESTELHDYHEPDQYREYNNM